jgi:hypothetical protein
VHRTAKVRRSPLPQKPAPSLGLRFGKWSRFLRRRNVVPSAPALRTRRSAVTSTGRRPPAFRAPALSGLVLDVADDEAAARPGLERADLGEAADVGPGVPRLGEVVVVEGVLAPVVAADVALAAEPAGVAGVRAALPDAVDVRARLLDGLAGRGRLPVVGERHGEVRELPVVAERLRRLLERPRLERPVTAGPPSSPRRARSAARGRRT